MAPRFQHRFSFGFPKYRLDTVGFSFNFSRLHVLECKVRKNRNLSTTTKEKDHNPCANRNKITTLQSKSDEKHTINTLLAYNSVVRDPFRNGSPIGKSRRLYVSPSPHSAMKTWIPFLLLLLSLSACSRHISEHIAVHDTLRLALTDTLREHITLTDSVLIHDTCYIKDGVATRFRLVNRWRQTDRVAEKSQREQRDRSHDHRARRTLVSGILPTGGMMHSGFWMSLLAFALGGLAGVHFGRRH